MARIEGPDGPRSWAIAMAGFIISTLLSGIGRATGLFYVALIEIYGVSRMEANFPFTLRNILRSLGGPVAGIIGQKYGARDVTFIGGVFASLGVILCCLAPSVLWISVLWGGMHGIGVALGNTLFPVVVNQYFLKYRATASGISISGACIGAFVFPVTLEFMLFHMGLSGTFLLTGGLIMNVLPAALLMTEPSWIKREQSTKLSLRVIEKCPKIRSVSQIVQRKIDEHTEAVLDITTHRPSPGGDSTDAKNSEDGFQPTTKNPREFSRNAVDNPAFVGSKTDLSEKSSEVIEVDIS